jgi:hypothetical protein
MPTFYTLVELDVLPEVREKGVEGYSVTDSLKSAIDHAWEDSQIIVAVDIDDPSSSLGVSEMEVERWMEALASGARTAMEGEEGSGLFSSMTGEPLTFDDPDDLKDAKALAELANNEDAGWRESIDVLGWADIIGYIGPERLSLASPVGVSLFESKGEFLEAVQGSEAKPLGSLGAAFWVWLMFFIQQLMLGTGSPGGEAGEVAKAKKKSAVKRSRKKRKVSEKKKTSKLEGANVGYHPSMDGAQINIIQNESGELAYTTIPTEDGRVEIWARTPVNPDWTMIGTADNRFDATSVVENAAKQANYSLSGMRRRRW